jgi:DNA-binding beta-propeller fold protein YncE
MQCVRFMGTVVVAAVFSILSSGGLSAAEGPYRFITKIDVGGEGGWDYASVDSAARRLYVTHGTKIVVIDLEKNTVAGEIADVPGVHGFAIASDLGFGFSSNGMENKASIVDLKALQTKSKVDTGANPNAILADPSQKEVYAFNGRGQSATVFEAGSGKAVATSLDYRLSGIQNRALSGRPTVTPVFPSASPKVSTVR